MAEVAFTPLDAPAGCRAYKWVLTGTDTGVPVQLAKRPDITVQMYGTFGNAVNFQWTNDPRGNPDDADHASAKWINATSAADGSTAIALSADGGKQVFEAGTWFRPSPAAAVTSVTIIAKGGA